MSYGLSGTTIVAYTYQADIVCADDMREIAKREAAKAGDAYMWADSGSAEDILNAWATAACIDRQDERTFDSGDFPKVVFASQIEDVEHCGQCGNDVLEMY